MAIHEFSYQPSRDPNLDARGKLRKGLDRVGVCLRCGSAGTEEALERIPCLGSDAQREANQREAEEHAAASEARQQESRQRSADRRKFGRRRARAVKAGLVS